jgi:hypothetical protein
MILILEDDADREAWKRGPEGIFMRLFGRGQDDDGSNIVWFSPEAYAEETVLSELRKRAEDLRTVEVDGSLYVGMVWWTDVMELLGQEDR